MRRLLIIGWIPLLLACGPEREKTTVTIGDISESAYASGTIKSRNQYQVFTAVNGLVKEVLVEEGDSVKKGQPIMRLAGTASQLMKENARLAAEYADLEANAGKLNELRLSIDLARSKVINDSLLMVRQQNLQQQNIGTRVELEQRQLAYKNSVTAWKADILRYNDLERQLRFAATQSRRAYEISTTQANDFTLTSEVDGKVYQLLKHVGEMATVQLPVAVLGEVDRFVIELEVDEYDIARIAPGQQVLITMDSYRGKVFEGVVDRIYPMMNERTKTFMVEAVFTKAPPTLYPNLTVESNIILLTKKNAMTIPRNFLLRDSLVITADGKERSVTTGLKDYQRVEITEGLQPGETILRP